jgi:antirestriction protein
MKTLTIMETAKVYVGTYAKYTNGSIAGEWLDLSDYSSKEEFLEACAELHSDEEDPEFMFQDFENIPDGLICESWISEGFFTYQEVLNEIDNPEAFKVFINHMGYDLAKEDAEDLKDSFEDAYCGEYNSELDYAYEIADEMMPSDAPDFLTRYFDYEAFCRDLFISDNWYEGGFVFRNI